ncbi:phage tail assembly protein [Dryocola clanedunensis]
MTYPTNTVEIALDFPFTTAGGIEIGTVTMRSPTVRDRVLRNKDKRPDIEADIHMIGSMCNLSFDDLMNMEGCDYLRLEQQFNAFLTPVSQRMKATS